MIGLLFLLGFIRHSIAATSLPSPGSLQRVSKFGSNPRNVEFQIYVPKNLAQSSPAVVAAVHHCQGTAQSFFRSTPYSKLAERYGFIVVYPSSPHKGTCWDVSSRATLSHEGGGDSNSIANMVKWTAKSYNADTRRLFVVGTSSGAMMSNVLAATYPDLFAAAIVYSGVPAGCFMSTSNGINAWNSTCSSGKVNSTPQNWARMAKNMYPSYNGQRPKMQIYHGGADTTLNKNSYKETIKQWCGVFGCDPNKPSATLRDSPSRGYTTSRYGIQLEGIFNPTVGHNLPVHGDNDMKWFGFTR